MTVMSEITREQFARSVIEIVRKRFPLAKIARSDQAFSLKINGRSASLENLYRLISLKPDDVQHQVERWALEMIRASEGTPDDAADFADLKDRILPMVVSRKADAPDDGLLTEPIVGDLHLAYVLDGDRTIAYLPASVLERWNVDLDTMHETAIANLVARSESMPAHAGQDENGHVNLILFQTLDGYDAARVLLPTLHDRLREHLGSPFVAAIPNRDILLCFRNDPEALSKLKRQVADDYRTMPHQVTDQLLLVTPDGLATLE